MHKKNNFWADGRIVGKFNRKAFDKTPFYSDNISMAEETKKEHENFFSAFLDLIFGNSERRQNNRELRQIEKHLVTKGYRYLKRGQVQPAFASVVYSAYEQTATSRTVFNKFSNPETLSYATLLAIVPDHIRSLLLRVEPNQIRETSDSTSYSELHTEIKNILITLKSHFTNEALTKLNNAYAQIVSFRYFCMYDYYLLLKQFNGELQENDFSKVPKFSSASAFSTSYLIADMETAFRYFMNSPDWTVINRFFKSIEDETVITQDDYDVMFQKISHLEKDQVLLSMCRLINRNSSYEINNATPPLGKMESVINKIFKDANSTVKEIFEAQKKQQIRSITVRLFDEETQTTLEYYSPKMSEELTQKHLGKYMYAEPVGYLSAYLSQNIATQFKKFTDTITIKGKSNQPAFMKDFFQLSVELEQVTELIAQLDLTAAPTSATGYRIIQAMRRTGDEHIDMTHIMRDIEEINNSAGIVLRKTRAILPGFSDLLKKLAEDSENKNEIISNWKEFDSINSLSTTEYLADLAQKTECMRELLEIFGA